jgi:pseudaminic acid cytidylyltransferase
MSCIAIIPARGGSVRIPRKNIKDFRGQPILAYAIQTATDSGLFAAVVVSTDDDEIAGIAMRLGALVAWRDKDDGTQGTQELAGDLLKRMPGITEACVIYPCTPLMQVADIRAAQQAMRLGAKFAMTVGTDPLSDAGCLYWGKADAFREAAPLLASHTALVPLPPERVCDINTPADWSRAEQLFDAMRAR